MLRKMLCCLLCCIAILCLTATSALASGDAGQLPQSLSLSFDFSWAEPQVRGTVDVRQVASMDENAQLTWLEAYRDAGVSLDELEEDLSAARLLVYAESKGLPAAKLQIGEDGRGTMELDSPGVYLVSQIEAFPGYSCMMPALICVPLLVDQSWIPAVEALPKLEPLIEESTEPTETTPHKPPPLPKTGQLNWPVPVLLLTGSVLILLGVCLRKDNRHEA